ncbi:ArnT family glycosyltransferase [Amycolatopsis taiwanensis]|uniref:Glycosyl transferase family 39 n=1 Tax=Amycolatopsis taiwanensis TaxID=342230 RepID=A0A9W6VEY5_9PSEU|nr:glycosyltransferase family 39 protein [Amycolatopsis taiwanensis]GLY68978.1 glycosyl transferase family 39 [Amycolatopsis taiwanensis]
MHTEPVDPRPPVPAKPELRPLAKGPVLGIAGIVAVAHLAFSPLGGYWIDEVYLLAIGKYHLDWGYVDQPPLAPLIAAAMDWIAPGYLPVLRLPAVLATAALVVLTALLAREFGGDRRAQVLAAGAGATGLWTAIVGHFVTPYVFEPALWLLLTWVLVRWIRLRAQGQGADRLLLLLGAVIGVTMQTKFQVAILSVTLLICVLVFGPRDILRRPMFWGGMGIAALIALPTLSWQAVNGWPQLKMGSIVADESDVWSGGRGSTALTLLVFSGVAGTALLVVGLVRLLTARELREYRFLAVAFLVLYAFFVATAGRPYYLIGLYGVLIAAGVVGFQLRREHRRPRWTWLAWPVYAASFALAGYLLTLSPKIAPSSGMTAESAAAQTSAAYAALPPDRQQHTAIIGESYVMAAMIEVGDRHKTLPEVYSPHRGYGFFSPPTDEIDSVLYVGVHGEPTELRKYCTDLRKVSGSETPNPEPEGLTTPVKTEIWLCSGRQGSWAEIWPQIKHLL